MEREGEREGERERERERAPTNELTEQTTRALSVIRLIQPAVCFNSSSGMYSAVSTSSSI